MVQKIKWWNFGGIRIGVVVREFFKGGGANLGIHQAPTFLAYSELMIDFDQLLGK